MMRNLPPLRCLLLSLTLLLTAATYRVDMQPESFVEYEASDSKDTWQGRAPLKTLNLTFDDEALSTVQLEAVLEPGAFDSGNRIRDANARRGVFETGQYPEITLRAQGVQAEATELGAGEAKRVTLVGTLEMHGVTREIRVPAEVAREGETLRAEGAFVVLLSDYDMDRPSFLGTTVDDEVTVRFQVVGRLAELDN